MKDKNVDTTVDADGIVPLMGAADFEKSVAEDLKALTKIIKGGRRKIDRIVASAESKVDAVEKEVSEAKMMFKLLNELCGKMLVGDTVSQEEVDRAYGRETAAAEWELQRFDTPV